MHTKVHVYFFLLLLLKNMSLVACLSMNGNIRTFKINQEYVNLYFENKMGFCGKIDCLNAFVVGNVVDKKDTPNPYCEKLGFDLVYSDIIILGSDENGDACDIEIELFYKWLRKNHV